MLNFKSKLLGALWGAIFTLAATGAYAELHKGEFSVGYFDQTHELTAYGRSYETDEDGWRYHASIFLRDNLSFSLALSELEQKSPTIIDTTIKTVGASYHFFRTDLLAGEGFGLSAGVERMNYELKYVESSSSFDKYYNLGNFNLTYGLGNGVSAEAYYSKDLQQSRDDWDMGIGIGKVYGDLILQAQYEWSENETDAVVTKSESDGISFTIRYLFY